MRICLAAFLTLFFLLPITSCSTITVRYDHDVDADFAGLRTFDWLSCHSFNQCADSAD